MLWVINGLIYGFFTAIYMLFNQHYKINGYVLGVWRGFGICLLFLPLLFFTPAPTSPRYWCLLIVQGICIGVYDSRLFFASAKFGAGPTSRFMAVTVLLTTFCWWFLTPQKFLLFLSQGNLLITLMLVLCGFSVSYWQMLKSQVSKQTAIYTLPAVLALSAMSIITKYIAVEGQSLQQGLTYYLTVSTFVSGMFNFIGYLRQPVKQPVISRKMLKIGVILTAFSSVLIVAKTMALRTAPNPGYVTALLLIAPVFIYLLNLHQKISDNISLKAGFAMIAFLIMLVVLIGGDFGIND